MKTIDDLGIRIPKALKAHILKRQKEYKSTIVHDLGNNLTANRINWGGGDVVTSIALWAYGYPMHIMCYRKEMGSIKALPKSPFFKEWLAQHFGITDLNNDAQIKRAIIAEIKDSAIEIKKQQLRDEKYGGKEYHNMGEKSIITPRPSKRRAQKFLISELVKPRM